MAVVAGEDAPRSGAHLAYVATEVVKVGALVTSGEEVVDRCQVGLAWHSPQ